MESNQLIAGVGLARVSKKSRWPARLDRAQSGTGLLLALFMWGHMLFVSSILLGKDAMWTVTKMFEGYFFFGKPYPILVSFVVLGVIVLLLVHAALAVRKFPINYRQWTTFVDHKNMLHHSDTTLWYWQVVTGFALFFIATPHLYVMLMHPDLIGPFGSADRVWTGSFWPLYIVLLLAVEMHAGIGLYRLSVKWDWFGGADPAATRKKLKTFKWALTVFLLALGFASLAAYIKIGIDQVEKNNVGKPYVPAALQSAPQGVVK